MASHLTSSVRSVTPTLVALVPVLDRPQNLRPLVESFAASLVGENVRAHMLFLVNPDDHRELAELRTQGLEHMVVPWPNGRCDYARKMNYGIHETIDDWVLLAADDLRFHPGWFRAAVDAHIRSGKLVVGTNDMVNPRVKAGEHATHPMLHRDYVKFGTVDDPTVVLHEGYAHNSVDVEFCETAMSRDQWVFAHDSLVEHRHPTFDRTVRRDKTYTKGLRFALEDKRLVNARRRLWAPNLPPTPRARVRLRPARPAPISHWPR